MTIDNVYLYVEATNQSYNKNQSLHWSLVFMANDRIESRDEGEDRICLPTVSAYGVAVLLGLQFKSECCFLKWSGDTQ